MLAAESSGPSPFSIGQPVRWVDAGGATAFGRVQQIDCDGDELLLTVAGNRTDLVESAEAVDFDDLEQVEAWLESGVD